MNGPNETVGAPPEVTPRLERVSSRSRVAADIGRTTVRLAVRGLPSMFSAERGRFVFRRECQNPTGLASRGESLRYTAIVLLGAGQMDLERQRSVLGGSTAGELCARLLENPTSLTDVGDLALLTWAAAELGVDEQTRAIDRLWELLSSSRPGFTVDEAWALSALVAARRLSGAQDRAKKLLERLLGCFSEHSGVFPHWTEPGFGGFRSHVGCFADQVYPIQALSRYHKAFGESRALEAASRCAETICGAQGDQGQWWWHYDTRTGQVVEGYPVYSVHQDSMAPMALLDLEEAGGPSHIDEIARGLQWLVAPPEVGESLLDEKDGVIWRKVGRRGPRKIVRRWRAFSSRIHPSLRLRWLETLFPPRLIDRECRPYHFGWILHCWLGGL